jgi:hypothetical protein
MGIVILIVSTAFLMWAASKVDNPLHKFGKAIGWIAVILSILTIVGQGVCFLGMASGMKCPMMERMHHMGPGMGEMPSVPPPAFK